MNEISKAFPDAVFIAEEDSASLDDGELAAQVEEFLKSAEFEGDWKSTLERAKRLDTSSHLSEPEYFWTIDPIDGTKGYLREGGQYAICAALMQQKSPAFYYEPVVSVLGCPEVPFRDPQLYGPNTTGTLFYASRGEGAYRVELFMQSPPIADQLTPSKRPVAIPNVVMSQGVDLGHFNRDFNDRFRSIAHLQKEPTGVESQVKYALIALGQVHLYLRCSPKGYKDRIWVSIIL